MSGQKVILITGASSGIGAACAEYLSNAGYRVYGTSRKPDSKNRSFEMLTTDVVDWHSIQKTVSNIIEKESRIDILINNAGMGIAGPLEHCSTEEILSQFDVNFFGLVKMCQAVIPHMKKQGGGTIINVSSLGGLLGLPYQAYYSATKFAVEGLSEAMRMELRQFNIHTVLVEPGDITTGFTKNRFIIEKVKDEDPELVQFRNTLKVIENDEGHGADPLIVARLIGNIIKKKHPCMRYTAATFEQKLVPFLKRILPYYLFEKIIASHYKV